MEEIKIEGIKIEDLKSDFKCPVGEKGELPNIENTEKIEELLKGD